MLRSENESHETPQGCTFNAYDYDLYNFLYVVGKTLLEVSSPFLK